MSFQEDLGRVLFLEEKYITPVNAERKANKKIKEIKFLKFGGRWIFIRLLSICNDNLIS